MDSQFDQWLSGSIHVPKPVLKENFQNNSSSQIFGRKVSSYTKLKLKNSETNKPIIIENPPTKNCTNRKKNISLSKSPLRSHSQKHYKIEKEKVTHQDIPHYVSPPRETLKKEPKKLIKTAKQEIKTEKPKISNIKALLSDTLTKNYNEKIENQKRAEEEELRKR